MFTPQQRTEAVERLHVQQCSCVICNNGQMRSFSGRGVSDLHRLLKEEPQFLRGAFVADKIVGKGAAALMILGGIGALRTDVISTPALELLLQSSIEVEFGIETPAITNRTGDGICPVEALCRDCTTARECLPLIDSFLERMAAAKK